MTKTGSRSVRRGPPRAILRAVIRQPNHNIINNLRFLDRPLDLPSRSQLVANEHLDPSKSAGQACGLKTRSPGPLPSRFLPRYRDKARTPLQQHRQASGNPEADSPATRNPAEPRRRTARATGRPREWKGTPSHALRPASRQGPDGRRLNRADLHRVPDSRRTRQASQGPGIQAGQTHSPP